MDIPGYYYDPEKGRYFKVERGQTAPANAAWSADNVKKRRAVDEQAAASSRRRQIIKDRIVRARVLNEPLTGGFFAREYGVLEADVQVASFALGLRDIGSAHLVDPRPYRPGTESRSPLMQVTRMYVGGQDYRTGMCTVHAAVGSSLLFTYIPRDKNGCINQRLLANYRTPARNRPPPYHFADTIGHVSDIQYHEPSNRLLLTSLERLNGPFLTTLWTTSPVVNKNGGPESPYWILPNSPPNGSYRSVPMVTGPLSDSEFEAHCVTPAPANSSLVCAVGTSRGIVQWKQGIHQASWLAPPVPLHSHHKRHSRRGLFRDVFAVDFDPSDRTVLHFGGRPGQLITADTRVRWSDWSRVKLPSTITHLRTLSGGRQVLVAGLQDQLGVYDLRFTRSGRGADDDRERVDVGISDGGFGNSAANNTTSRANHNRDRGGGQGRGSPRQKPDDKPYQWAGDVASPVVRFEQYRNAARPDIGFAYDASTGLVAAAHDASPGSVVLYSARTGSQLRVLELDSLAVVSALQFQTFPGDRTPTLFVGAGAGGAVRAFSFAGDEGLSEG
ncbi:hypothetical protein F4861DRAFT_503106 [Xylaria intraflava]|nr:hypothetical protein F4861DRAFT_503106 [Xylaria intraflava]